MMADEELVDLIAESIYTHLRDIGVATKDYIDLSHIEKEPFLSAAHDIMSIFDDFYDAELDDEDESEDEEEDIIDEW